ncbi:MAG: hypothetical protein A2X77_04785 [Gammaproteobacteria bacterium GWE2_42_36]|nr:MAG: hypothetical protein A2X77_04785 [Gammaproteobacteria bacterium GWE2_42_36]
MIYKWLPYFLFKPLFGDRRRWGLKADPNDADFKQWSSNCYMQFYHDNQKGTIGSMVNHYGFRIMRHVDLTGKRVLEVGPGIIEHLSYNHTRPESYFLVDIKKEMLTQSAEQLKKYGIHQVKMIQVTGTHLPLETDSVDMVITFHQLEHIYELDQYVQELKRVLKPSGLIVGAVPAEGGMAWGVGRFLTSRRYVKKNMPIDYDKIICWEHPNFVNKLKQILNKNFESIKSIKKPFCFLPMDFNLSWSFIFRNVK